MILPPRGPIMMDMVGLGKARKVRLSSNHECLKQLASRPQQAG